MTRVAAVLLAAGASERFGPHDKLLASIDGEPLVVRVARRLREAGLGEVVAVVREAGGQIRHALAPHVSRIVVNPDAERGMGGSIACGVASLGPACAGAMIVPGDMPGLTPELIARLIFAFDEARGERIVHPVLPGGEQRNPVLWPRRFLPALAALTGPAGGKHMLRRHSGETVAIPVGAAAEVADIDTAAELEAWHAAILPPHRPVT